MISAVLLDAGNTLVELDYGRIAAMFAQAGFPRDPATLRAAADGMRPAFDAFLAETISPAESRGTLAFFLGGFFGALDVPPSPARDRLAARLGASFSSLWSRPVEGSFETIEALHQLGIRLAIVSNSDGSVERDAAGWPGVDRIETIVDSGVVGVEKPDPEIFRIALRRLGVAPEEAIHVGDLPSVDVAGARAAGVGAVLLDPGDLFPEVDAPRIRRLPEIVDLVTGGGSGAG